MQNETRGIADMKKLLVVGCMLAVLAVRGGVDHSVSLPVVQDVAKRGWTATFTFSADGLSSGCTLVDIPGVVRVAFRFAGTDHSLDELDNRFGNYLNFKTADGRCPVVEATIPGASTIGVPLGALKRPDGTHKVTIRRGADAQWFMTVDEGYDEDGLRAKEIAWPKEASAAVCSDRVKDFAVVSPAVPRLAEPDARPIERPIQFWTPPGHNTWVGDVVVGVFKNRFHVFYLIDRRHHASKGGAGGHYFAHLSSGDLVHWVEHPTAVGLDAWWQTLGTGTPFVWDGKLCLAYGLHTTRFMPSAETTEPFLKKYFAEHGDTGVFDFDAIEGYPLGAAYAVSEDGVHFTRVNRLIHSAQNPTIYNRADGRLGFVNSYGGIHGIYVSDGKLGSKWLKEAPPPGEVFTFACEAGRRFSTRFAGSGGTLEFSVDATLARAQFADVRADGSVPRCVTNAERNRAGGNKALANRNGPPHGAHEYAIERIRGLTQPYTVRIAAYYDPKADVTLFDAEIAAQRTMICRRAGRYVHCSPLPCN